MELFTIFKSHTMLVYNNWYTLMLNHFISYLFSGEYLLNNKLSKL